MDEAVGRSIYHLAPAEEYEAQRGSGWFLTKDLAVIGFIHCVASRRVLLSVANAFYRGEPGDFVVLKIEENRLDSTVKYEAPSAVHVGGRTYGADGDADHPISADTRMPHVFGPINLTAVVDVNPATRDENGNFISVD